MKKAIPPRTTKAPTAIPIALPPDRLLEPEPAAVVEMIVGVVLVVVGVGPAE